MATTKYAGTTGMLGNGGGDYNTADSALKKKIAQNQLNIKSNPNFVQSEVQRTLQVIQNRQNQGMDTSAQQKYLTNNLGYKAPTTSTAATTPTMTGTTTTLPAVTTPKTNAQQGSELMDLMRQYAQKQATPFSYDPNSDPSYQAALKRTQQNINDGNSAVQAELNRRGILNSTITSDRMAETSANAMNQLESEIVPTLQQQAYQQYLNNLQQEQQQFANLGSLASMYQNEDQRNFGNRVTEAGLTGNYMPEGAQNAINAILQLKQQAETKGISAAELAKLSAQADGYRAQLLSMGIDPTQYAATVNYNTARTNKAGLRTLQGQAMDLQNKQANLDAANAVSQLTGRLVSPQGDWSGLYRQATNPNAPLTMAGQNQAFNQNLANQQFAYQKARDAISDQQWRAKFDEDARQFGLSYALNMLSEQNQQAYREAQIGLAQDDNARSWAQLDAELAQQSAPTVKYDGMNPTQVLDAARQRFSVTNKDGAVVVPQDNVTKDKIYQYVGSMGLPDTQANQVMLSLGLTSKDIDSYDKKYGYGGQSPN